MRILEMFTPFHSYLPSNNAFLLLLTCGKFILCVFTDSQRCGNSKLNLRFSNKKLLRSQVDFTDLYNALHSILHCCVYSFTFCSILHRCAQCTVGQSLLHCAVNVVTGIARLAHLHPLNIGQP